jgi:hypothetical protein
MLALSDKWASALVSQPETGMGYQVATVTLKDGRRFPNAVLVGGGITKTGDNPEIPFVESDIESITIDHGK